MPKETAWPFSKETADLICDLVAEGQNLHVIGQLEGYPPRWRIYEWLKEDEEFADNYARAREDRADWRSARIDKIVSDLLSAQIDPQAARVAIDAEKWQASHEKPKSYGDRKEVDITSKGEKLEGSKVLVADKELVKQALKEIEEEV